MGGILSVNTERRIMDYVLDEAVRIMNERAAQQGNRSVAASLVYLKRDDVRRLGARHLREVRRVLHLGRDCILRSRLATSLSIVFFELDLMRGEDVCATLNFWPCDHRACVSLSYVTNAAE